MTSAPAATPPITFKVGDANVIVLVESRSKADLSKFPSLATGLPDGLMAGSLESTIAFFVVQYGGDNVLIDAGFGIATAACLKSAAIDPASINHILITHLHGDHIGGVKHEGKLLFPNAQIHIAVREHSHWSQPAAGRGSELWVALYGQIKEQVSLFLPAPFAEGGVLIAKGITAIACYGHTPGHTLYLLDGGGGARMLFAGDFCHLLEVQAAHPEVCPVYDSESLQATAARREVFSWALENSVPIAGCHLPLPCVIDVVAQSGDGWTWKRHEV